MSEILNPWRETLYTARLHMKCPDPFESGKAHSPISYHNGYVQALNDLLALSDMEIPPLVWYHSTAEGFIEAKGVGEKVYILEADADTTDIELLHIAEVRSMMALEGAEQ